MSPKKRPTCMPLLNEIFQQEGQERGWSRRRIKKTITKAARRGLRWEKRARDNHRVWTWAGQQFNQWGETNWIVRSMRQPFKFWKAKVES